MEPDDIKKEEEAPLLKNHIEETVTGFTADEEAVKERLMREYPSPESAIESCRKGYISDVDLNLRFTPEEIDYIRKECDEREAEDSAMPTGGVM
jgi:hypothetical protein